MKVRVSNVTNKYNREGMISKQPFSGMCREDLLKSVACRISLHLRSVREMLSDRLHRSMTL